MGSAIARGLVQGTVFRAEDITVIDVCEAPLKALQATHPDIRTALDNFDSVASADMILLAVKPWLIGDTIFGIKHNLDYARQIIISIAAGIDFETLALYLHPLDKNDDTTLPALFRVVPNTAIAIRQSMTLIAAQDASSEQQALVLRMFEELGSALLLDESKLTAGTAITSCGIAYLFRYIRAAMLAGVEMGFYPKEAQNMAVKTMLGAAALLDATGEHPETEIDKVTTPGGITIKGLNELEANGFSDAIIRAMRVSR
jgi:pyrroline-5-carboxylate reductase